MSKSYSDLFLDAVGYGLSLYEKAQQNKLPDTIDHGTLILLMVNNDPTNFESLKYEIGQACGGRQIRCEEIPGSEGTPVATQHESRGGRKISRVHVYGRTATVYLIHRDSARRYFQSLNLMPEEGSPLWCWIRNKPASEARQKTRRDQQDKADFQHLCSEHWKISPMTKIRGADGVVDVVTGINGYFIMEYEMGTLENWASEVAPEEVKARRGRPKKPPSD